MRIWHWLYTLPDNIANDMGGRYCAINSPRGSRRPPVSGSLPPPRTEWWVNCAIPTAHVILLLSHTFYKIQYTSLKTIKTQGHQILFNYVWSHFQLHIVNTAPTWDSHSCFGVWIYEMEHNFPRVAPTSCLDPVSWRRPSFPGADPVTCQRQEWRCTEFYVESKSGSLRGSDGTRAIGAKHIDDIGDWTI